MNDQTHKRLGDLLVESGAVSRADVELAADAGRRTARLLGDVLQQDHDVEERQIYQQLARQRGIRFASAEELLKFVDVDLARRVPGRFRDFHRLIPICRNGDQVVVATSDPAVYVPSLASALEAGRIDLRLITPTDYQRLRAGLDLGQLGAEPEPAGGPRPIDLAPAPESIDSATIALFDAIVLDAVACRASDIHLEIYGDRPRVRIRVDGDLREVTRFRFTPAQFMTLVNVGKVKSRLDIAEHRAPQGGRFSTRVGDQVFDVRVQTQPSLHGEHLILRLLPQERRPLSIPDLGFSDDLASAYQRLLASPGGLVLVVGPTGSGKTTTLYAGLQLLARDPTRKVISVEDPIEYAIDGVQQTQVLPEVGFTFANAMRAFVREDPDVILVGEIRDPETALEALRASQTGHLVLSTLHCNDTVDAVQRLLDLGMHPNSVGSELLAVVSQRLAKRICNGCRQETTPDPALAVEVFPDGLPPGFTTWRGAGCERCGGFGSYGRVAVAELLPATPELRTAISRRPPLDELRELARAAGLIPLRENALDLVRKGVIAFEELRDMIPPDQLRGPPAGTRRPVRAA